MMDSLPWITFEGSPDGTLLSQFQHSDFPATCAKPTSSPFFITFVGKKKKSLHLQHLLQFSSPLPGHREVYLRSSAKLQVSGDPVIIIDCGAQAGPTPRAMANPDTQSMVKVSWELPPLRNVIATLCGRILSPFSGVFCCFVSDLGGMRATAQWLAWQAHVAAPSDISVAPYILLVAETTSDIFDESIARTRILTMLSEALRDLKDYTNAADIQCDIDRHFRSITVLGLRPTSSIALRSRLLKNRIMALSQLSLQERVQQSFRFSFVHFQTLTKQALDNLCKNGIKTIQFAETSRPLGFTANLMQLCLQDFLTQMPSQTWLWTLAAPLVASSLLLANYPPSAHDFAPEFLFPAIFFNPCLNAVSQYTEDEDIRRKFVAGILAHFQIAFTKYLHSGRHASDIHRQNLSELHPHMTSFKSHQSCFCCFMRMPEKVLVCGHALCDPCIRIFGHRSNSEKYTYELHECILCGVNYQKSIFRFVPPTAGIRVLSIDGGGIRGVVPLMFLKHLDTLLSPLHCSVRDQFDYVCGTSAGGLIAIGMFLLQWGSSESIQQFENVAKQTFGRRKEGLTFLAKAFELLAAYINDGQYSIVAIKNAFRKTFHSPIQMFNPLRNDTKVAVTTTTVSDSAPALLTNYNGGKRPENIGYGLLRADEAQHDITLSDAACCTSAAPWFFKPQVVNGLKLQDGGLEHNMPADIAEWERIFLWPNKPNPDFALSLGTGTCSAIDDTSSSGSKGRFYVRLFRSFMSSLDGERAWRKFRNSLPKATRNRYHRLNIQFSGVEPRLDDVRKIPELKSRVLQTIHKDDTQVMAVMDSMMSSIFYFELDGYPALDQGKYKCTGYFHCRLDLPNEGRLYLYNWLLETSSWFVIQGRPIRCVQSVPKSLPPFKRRVKFYVDTAQDIISCSIKGITSSPKLISGFPTTLERLIKDQQLDGPFGTVDHLLPEKPLPAIPSKRRSEVISCHDTNMIQQRESLLEAATYM